LLIPENVQDPEGTMVGTTRCDEICGTGNTKEGSWFSQLTDTFSLEQIKETVCAGLCWAFYPEETINALKDEDKEIDDKTFWSGITELEGTIITQPPFGYFFVYRDAITDLVSSTTSTVSEWQPLSQWTFWQWIRTLMGYIIYGLFAVFVYKFFRKVI